MRICYLSLTPIPSRVAGSVHIMQMCHAYANIGYQVKLVVPYPAGPLMASKEIFEYYGISPNFEIQRFRQPSDKRLSALFLILGVPLLALRQRPTMIHTRSVAVAWGLVSAYRRPAVLEMHNSPGENKRRRKMFEQVIGSPRLNGLVVITQALADHLSGIPRRAPLIVAPDGIPTELLSRDTDRSEARNRLGIGAEARRIAVYTGHLYAGRGIELIINLASLLPDHLFLVVGGHPEDVDRYRNQAPGLRNIKFVGFVPPSRVWDYMISADVLLMPYGNVIAVAGGGNTAKFASPMKMFEYMAAGRPILSSTLPVLQEVLTDGDNALLLPYDEPQRWVEAMRTLQENPGMAEVLGQRARADVEEFTWERRAQRILQQVR